MVRVWQCLDMQKNEDCKDPEGNKIEMPSGTNQASIKKNLLAPYQAYQINFNVTK
jgi:hypothetical protein